MGAIERSLIVLCVMFFGVLLKWILPRVIAPAKMRKLCHRFLRAWPKFPSFGYMLRSIGWDTANAAWGLMILACILECSNLRRTSDNLGNYGPIFIVFCFIILVILYGCAIECRYIFMETAERVDRKRVPFGLVLWVLGLMMLLYSSWLVT